MDLTSFVITQRDNALTVGSYSTYRSSLSRQLHNYRKRLSLLSPRNGFKPKMDGVSAENIGSNYAYAHLFILTAERARAHALSLKAAHAANLADKEISGRNRSHIVSRFTKAAKLAGQLVALLRSNPEAAKATQVDLLEAISYHYTLLGECEFFKLALGDKNDPKAAGAGESGREDWKACLTRFAVARMGYGTLLSVQEGEDCFREILSQVVDPSMEYASYRAHRSRKTAVLTVAKTYFPKNETEIKQLIESVNLKAFEDSTETEGEASIVGLVSWRGKSVEVSDAAIGQALASIQTAKTALAEKLGASVKTKGPQHQAELYDDILTACQDTSDRVRQSIEELQREGASEADARMQSLRLINLAVNYDLIKWRIGRNRTLLGSDDGVRLGRGAVGKHHSEPSSEEADTSLYQYISSAEGMSKRVGRLRERTVLYDAILQSIVSIKELPGAARDEQFVEELDAQYRYFRALRCLNLAYYHATQAASANVLGLLVRAEELIRLAAEYILKHSTSSSTSSSQSAVRDLTVTPSQALALSGYIQGLRLRYHGLVDIQTSMAEDRAKAAKWAAAASAGVPPESQAPLIERMGEWIPARGIDPTRLVDWPTMGAEAKVKQAQENKLDGAVPSAGLAIRPLMMKPVYLDLAWDFVQYPGVEPKSGSVGVGSGAAGASRPAEQSQAEAEKPKKKGWFW